MNIAQNIINNINGFTLLEKASIDWNNYLTPEEVQKFLEKDDKVESAENIIYSKDFEKRYKDLHNDLQKKYNNSWTKNELVHDLEQFYNNGHLITEGILNENIHLYGFVKDQDGNSKIIEDYDYSNKNSFKADLVGNGYTVRRISDNRDMYIMDHSNFLSVAQVKNEINKLKKDLKYNKENGYTALMSDVQSKINNLEDLLKEANNISLTENAKDLWKSQIDSKDETDLANYLVRLYKQLQNYNSNDIKSNKYYELLDKIEYIESKTGSKPNLGRILH